MPTDKDTIAYAVKCAWRDGVRDKQKLIDAGLLAALHLPLRESVAIAQSVYLDLTSRSVSRHTVCEHRRRKSRCSLCRHGRKASTHGKAAICKHGKRRTRCQACGGGSLCTHGRLRTRCSTCLGGELCRHGYRKGRGGMCQRCKDEYNPDTGMAW